MYQQQVRYGVFLRDVLMLAVTTFGGPQAHLAHFQKILVTKRNYLSVGDLMELNSLCQILPGPSSTQTLVSIGYKLGGASLAYLTLLVWTLPTVIFMTVMAISLFDIEQVHPSLAFTRFIQPMAVGYVSYAAYSMTVNTVTTKTGICLMIFAAVTSYFIQTPFVFPAILFIAGLISALKYRAQPREEKKKISIRWSNLILWIGVLVFAALMGWATKNVPEVTRPVRLFENFYRTGSLVFGGGHVLVPMLATEFVEKDSTHERVRPVEFSKKPFLTNEEFLTGYAIAQTLPGPVFSFSAFIGSLSMREYGTLGEITGAFMAALGIFLPGTFMIFFVIRFWDSLKKYRAIRASLEGVNAASAGLIAAAAIILFQPLDNTVMNFGFTIGTFCLLTFTRLPSPYIILGGLALGLLF